MPFAEVDIKAEIEKNKRESDEFRSLWDGLREESRLVDQMARIRKEQRISQAQLAKLVKCQDTTIIRMEKREISPSLKLFIRILDILGYQLQIVKKESNEE